ncbi:MAG: EAL and GGDEF domain-containing protein [Gammaproteobacteria bacterium]|nr:EAL and GGDEF domain-containing protein [Gammaproteobacteria bacterium]
MLTELINCHPEQELDHHLFDEYQALVHRIIDQETVYSVFQPIIHLDDGSILGYEALLRGPEATCFHAPIPLFQAAEAVGRLFELECIARKKAIQRFIELDLPGKLFLNMSPMSLQDPNFQSGQTLALIDSFGFSPQRIVIEITEHHPVQDYQLLIKAVEHYRGMGFTIALDDLGEGHSSLRLWSELRPDYVKLDKHFVTHLEAEGKHKLQFVKIITELAQSVETQVIAEGVETLGCLELLQSINVHLGQGYYFAKPSPTPVSKPQWQMPDNVDTSQTLLSRYARDIVQTAPSIKDTMLVSEAVDFFLQHPEHQAVAVVNEHTVLGLLERKQMTDLFSSRYGRELNARKRIDQFIDKRSLIVSANTPLEIISKMITQRDHNNAQGVFVITDASRYVGLGYFNDLLRAITETKIALAKSANPLSGLPGNQAIENAIQKRLNNRKNFLLLYVDLDHFKAFNDYFSYELGDKALIMLAQILEKHTHHSEFLGHIGGDDFILLWKEKDWQKRLERIFHDFTSHYPDWYSQEQIKQQGFTGKDRNDQTQFFSLMSLSVGVIPIEAGQFEFHHQLARFSSEAKKKAKAIAGNSWHLFSNKS